MIIVAASLLIGILCVFLGYKLLMRGVYSNADPKAVWADTALLIKRGTPGAVFALFGGSMIVVGVLHADHLRHRDAPPAPEQTQTEKGQPLKQATPAQPPKHKRARDERNTQHAPAQRATQPADTSHERESSGEDPNQPQPAPKVFKPGRA
jgi:hypothetical protein